MTATSFAFTAAQRQLLDSALSTGYGQWAGAQLLAAEPGLARLSFQLRPEMLTPWGTLNGGVINGLLELPSFIALLTALEPGEFAVTNDFFLQHVRPLPGAVEYQLEGRLLRKGKTMAWTEATAFAAGKPCSFARITKSLARMPAAQ
jgi:acyl-coenzyme A thioesterase PaaI-like protein